MLLQRVAERRPEEGWIRFGDNHIACAESLLQGAPGRPVEAQIIEDAQRQPLLAKACCTDPLHVDAINCFRDREICTGRIDGLARRHNMHLKSTLLQPGRDAVQHARGSGLVRCKVAIHE